jgi:hypothetical protein
MTTKRAPWTGFCRSLLFFSLVAITPGILSAQAEPPPPNAHPKLYGSGWERDRGYDKARQKCTGVNVPVNAYLDRTGNGWKCERGLRQRGGICGPIDIPRSGYPASSGNDGDCDAGYRLFRGTCATGGQ